MNDEFLPVKRDISQFLQKWPNAEWGPGHAVLSDWNLSDHHIDWACGLIAQILDRDYVLLDDVKLLAGLNYYEIYDGGELRHSKLEFLETYGFLVVLKCKYSEDVRESHWED